MLTTLILLNLLINPAAFAQPWCGGFLQYQSQINGYLTSKPTVGNIIFKNNRIWAIDDTKTHPEIRDERITHPKYNSYAVREYDRAVGYDSAARTDEFALGARGLDRSDVVFHVLGHVRFLDLHPPSERGGDLRRFEIDRLSFISDFNLLMTGTIVFDSKEKIYLHLKGLKANSILAEVIDLHSEASLGTLTYALNEVVPGRFRVIGLKSGNDGLGSETLAFNSFEDSKTALSAQFLYLTGK